MKKIFTLSNLTRLVEKIFFTIGVNESNHFKVAKLLFIQSHPNVAFLVFNF